MDDGGVAGRRIREPRVRARARRRARPGMRGHGRPGAGLQPGRPAPADQSIAALADHGHYRRRDLHAGRRDGRLRRDPGQDRVALPPRPARRRRPPGVGRQDRRRGDRRGVHRRAELVLPRQSYRPGAARGRQRPAGRAGGRDRSACHFAITWALVGVLSVLAGTLWSFALGGGFGIELLGLKVFPIVILGGLDSLPGTIIGAFFVGILESLAAGYIDPLVGGGFSHVASYVALIAVLFVRPYGLFRRPDVERV